MSTTLLHCKQATRRWLTFLFVAGFLLNIQSSYACAMMPDMEQKQMECCCGGSHRMDDMTDLERNSSAMVMHHDMAVNAELTYDRDSICNDPQMACCEVEVSVGINDPPTDSTHALVSNIKASPHKLVKQLDSHYAVASFSILSYASEPRKFEAVAKPPDPGLNLSGPALYMTTRRYRI